MSRAVPSMLAAVAVLAVAAPARGVMPAASEAVSFSRDVRPILADRCFHCHGPDEGVREAGLRLDRPDGEDGAYRARFGLRAIAPGSLEDSEVWYRLATEDPEERMPPLDSHKAQLTDEERDVLRRWIEAGAEYEAHWAFVGPTKPQVPPVDEAGAVWARGPIDAFVLERLRQEDLRPSAEADPRTLLRRVSFDLTGLPPTRAEIATFLEAWQRDADAAYAAKVDELLARSAHGEHMARTWLDLVRFADTNGIHHDHYREMSPYRDWVIGAFHNGKPFDEFVTEQLAGDVLPGATDEQRIASGFNRLHMIIDVGTALPEESFAKNVIDRTTAFGTAFLGLTVGCAVCHDHKYDPLTQRDFYSLSAFFNNVDAAPETGSGDLDKRRGLQPPYIELPSEEQLARRAELQAEVDAAQARADAGEEGADEELRAARRRRNDHTATVPAAMVMRERAEPRPAHVLIRGAYDQPGSEAPRTTPGFLPPLPTAAGTLPSRLDLARWLTAPENPLFARVAVNRFWQQLFGVGLVKTSEDLGLQGEPPSHPELLDYLAVSFRDSGWDVKALLRTIVTSATYRQSSRAEAEAFARDPENRLLARGSRYRLDAEQIRDAVLATSGLLNREMYGKSVKPPQPPGVWKAVTLPSSYPVEYRADVGDATRRRSLYTFWKRAMPPVQMSILNAPTREFCTARRERTNTPLQALLLMNEAEWMKAARHLAVRTLEESASSDRERVDALFETVTSHLPGEEEAARLAQLALDLEAIYADDAELTAALLEGSAVEGVAPARLAAWTVVASAIYNLDIVKTKE